MFKQIFNTNTLFKRPLKLFTLFLIVNTTSLVGCDRNHVEQPHEDNKADSISTEQVENKIVEDTAEATEFDNKIASKASVTGDKVTVSTNHGDVTIPLNPKPIAVYDMTIMQDLVALGVEADGLPEKLLLDNFKVTGATSTDVGTIFEPNLEKVHALKSQAIFIGGRSSSKYAELNKIAPTLDLSTDWEDMYGSSLTMLTTLGDVFDKSDKANELVNNIQNLVNETKQVTTGKGNGLILLVNGNKISAMGSNSRFGFIHKQFDIPMADENIEEHTHGESVSFEYIQQTNPDWLFVLDRTSAIRQEGPGALEVLDNELIHQTTAWKKQQIVLLSPDSYLAFGGYYQWMTDATTIKTAFEAAN